MCKCTGRKASYQEEFMSFYCLKCGRIWVNEFCSGLRSTERFKSVQTFPIGVWVGHTFFPGATLGGGIPGVL